MSEQCRWLHEQLERLPPTRYPFDLEALPANGIYFFYEDGEVCGHNGYKPRIVRIGTHKDGNFQSRIAEHFLCNWPDEIHIDPGRAAPKDRSIFRKNLGRALLNQRNDDYLAVWEIDFTKRRNRVRYGHLRDVEKEEHIEALVTSVLRKRFSFTFIILDNQQERMGSNGLESCLIGTVAQCRECRPSDDWLGKDSPKEGIKAYGLWQVQHLRSEPIDDADKSTITEAIAHTLAWLSHRPNSL